MAITILKSSKATPAKGMEYITDDGKAALVDSRNLDPNRDYANQMMNTAMLWDKAQDENSRKYYHFKLSFDPKDWTENGGTLTEQEAMEIGLQLISEYFPTYEAVGAVHTDRKHLHFHGMINAVDLATGDMIHMNDREYRRFKDRAQEICAERGLTTIDWREATAQKRAAEKQAKQPIEETFAEKGLKSRGKTPWKDELRTIVDQAVGKATTMDEFKKLLESRGVTLTRCTDKTISYKLGDHKACRGDTLGGDYTVQAVRDAIKHNQTKPLQNNKSFDAIYANADQRAKNSISEADREIFRAAGRQIGLKRADIDELCNKAGQATWEDKQAAWEAYRQAQADYWERYYREKEYLQKSFEEYFEWKKHHRGFLESLYYNQHRGLMASLFLLAVVIVKPDLIHPDDEYLQALREEYAKLQMEMKVHRKDTEAWRREINAINEYNRCLQKLDDRVNQVAAEEIQYSRQGRVLNVAQRLDDFNGYGH